MNCPNCEGLRTVDPLFVKEARAAFTDLMVELVVFADQNKIDHRKMPVLQRVARMGRIIEML